LDPFIEVIGPAGLRIELREGDSVVIGRDPGPGGILISNFEVSRQHVRLDVKAGVLEVTELGSTNGTSIVRTGVSTAIVRDVQVPMHPGDQLLVNGHVVLCSVGGVA
jgi:pSer/pThr/pTyr-binding forkhead associated (FHA) protein